MKARRIVHVEYGAPVPGLTDLLRQKGILSAAEWLPLLDKHQKEIEEIIRKAVTELVKKKMDWRRHHLLLI